VLKTRIKQLETLIWVNVKRIRHDSAMEYVTNDLKAWFEEKSIASEMTAPYKSQQNGKAERANRTLMERVRAALLDAGAEEDLWAEALASVVPVLNRSPQAGLYVTPLEARTGRRLTVAGFRVSGSRAWALKPKKQQRKPQPRTDVGRFVGYTVGGMAYRILEDETHKVFERRDVLMEENPAKVRASAVGSSAGPRLTAGNDGGKDDATEGATSLLRPCQPLATCLRRISSTALWRATARWTCTTPSMPTETKTSATTKRAYARPRSHTASRWRVGAYCGRVTRSAAPPTAAAPLQTNILAPRRRTTTRVAVAAAAAAAVATAASRVPLLASKLPRRSGKTTSRWTLKSRTVLRPSAS